MSWVLLCSHATVKWGIQLCRSSPNAKTTNWCCRPLFPSQCSCKGTAWISSHFCKCNSQVSPPRRGPRSGNRGSRASSSLCSYSIKPHQRWKYNLWKKKKEKERKNASVKLSHSAAQNFLLCFFHHLLIAPLLCSLSNSSWGCQAPQHHLRVNVQPAVTRSLQQCEWASDEMAPGGPFHPSSKQPWLAQSRARVWQLVPVGWVVEAQSPWWDLLTGEVVMAVLFFL